MQVSVKSYINPIFSNIEGESQPQIETREINSLVQLIESHTERNVKVSKNVPTYLSPIHSNVTTNVISSNKEIRDVFSHMNPIYSNVSITIYRQPVVVTRNVVSHIRQIQANVDLPTPLDTLPLVAYITVHENPSITSTMTNLSNSTHIENPSFVEVIE